MALGDQPSTKTAYVPPDARVASLNDFENVHSRALSLVSLAS
jgi:hypothetical protein